MPFKESANKYLANIAQKHPKLFIGGLFAIGVGSYNLMDYIANTFPGIGTFLVFVLGVPGAIGAIILILYILWKIYKMASWYVENSHFPWWRGPLG